MFLQQHKVRLSGVALPISHEVRDSEHLKRESENQGREFSAGSKG